jgi:hypothetical protein
MGNLDIMTKALDMLQVPKKNQYGRRDLDRDLYDIVENLLLESLGEPPEYDWVNESVRKIRPDCHADGLFNRKVVAPIYENLMQVYDFIKSHGVIKANGRVETERMIRFEKYIWMYKKTTEHPDMRGICKDETPEKNPQKLL